MHTIRRLAVCVIACLTFVALNHGLAQAQETDLDKEAAARAAIQKAAAAAVTAADNANRQMVTRQAVVAKNAARNADAPNDPFAEPKKDGEASKDSAKNDLDKPNTDTQPKEFPVDPEIVRIFLEDGSIITGKLAIKNLTIKTDFGPLHIPITKIHRFQPGLNSYPGRAERITTLIADLAAGDFKRREKAEKDLVAMGLPVRKEIASHVNDGNAERVKRVKAILEKLDELAEDEDDRENASAQKPWIREDLIETDEFTVLGKIDQQSFNVDSKYGKLRIELSDITSANRAVGNKRAETVHRSLAVEGQYLIQLRYKSCKIQLNRGDRVIVKASGRINMAPWGSRSFSTPDGAANYGTLSKDGKNFYSGTLVAKIGSKGKAFKIGTKNSFIATQSGTLQFAIAMQSSYGRGNYQFPGQYNLKIKVDRADED